MLEFYLDAEGYRRLDQFKGKKPAVGLRPMIVFAGTAWESTVDNEYTTAKSLLTDFFAGERGAGADKIDVEGLQYVVVCTAEEESAAAAVGDGSGLKPAVHLRVYLIRTRRSGQRLPRVEVRKRTFKSQPPPLFAAPQTHLLTPLNIRTLLRIMH